MSTPTRGLCIAGALVLGGLVSTQLWFKHSSNAQNSLWLMLSMGVFGDLLKPPKPLRGVPELCGNANPLHTLSWMNPIDFNSTTVGHLDHESRLHAAAPDAPIFVVGCGHSGTTELITLLDRHPLVRAYLDGPGMEFAIQPNSFDSPWGLLPVRKHNLPQPVLHHTFLPLIDLTFLYLIFVLLYNCTFLIIIFKGRLSARRCFLQPPGGSARGLPLGGEEPFQRVPHRVHPEKPATKPPRHDGPRRTRHHDLPERKVNCRGYGASLSCFISFFALFNTNAFLSFFFFLIRWLAL